MPRGVCCHHSMPDSVRALTVITKTCFAECTRSLAAFYIYLQKLHDDIPTFSMLLPISAFRRVCTCTQVCYGIMWPEVIPGHGGPESETVPQRVFTDPACHQIPCNTSSREVAFGIKIKCSRQFSMFSLHRKLWRITSLTDIITYSGTTLDLTSMSHLYSAVLDTTSVQD